MYDNVQAKPTNLNSVHRHLKTELKICLKCFNFVLFIGCLYNDMLACCNKDVCAEGVDIVMQTVSTPCNTTSWVDLYTNHMSTWYFKYILHKK